jgi:hypothetical protein
MNDNERVVKKESVVQIIHLTSYNFYNYLSVYLLNASNGDRRDAFQAGNRPAAKLNPTEILHTVMLPFFGVDPANAEDDEGYGICPPYLTETQCYGKVVKTPDDGYDVNDTFVD